MRGKWGKQWMLRGCTTKMNGGPCLPHLECCHIVGAIYRSICPAVPWQAEWLSWFSRGFGAGSLSVKCFGKRNLQYIHELWKGAVMSEDIDKHVIRKYHVGQKLGKGVSIYCRSTYFIRRQEHLLIAGYVVFPHTQVVAEEDWYYFLDRALLALDGPTPVVSRY